MGASVLEELGVVEAEDVTQQFGTVSVCPPPSQRLLSVL